MKTNMGIIDRVVRVLAAIIVAYLYFSGMITGATGIVLLIIAFIFVITSFLGFCPVYTILGVKTCKSK
ncbi:MAG: DUF2892 domain-containing protein [Bacteroidetes bacterium]|nr:DUF2892 domain-containing protein [Bacteroidota bacterium]